MALGAFVPARAVVLSNGKALVCQKLTINADLPISTLLVGVVCFLRTQVLEKEGNLISTVKGNGEHVGREQRSERTRLALKTVNLGLMPYGFAQNSFNETPELELIRINNARRFAAYVHWQTTLRQRADQPSRELACFCRGDVVARSLGGWGAVNKLKSLLSSGEKISNISFAILFCRGVSQRNNYHVQAETIDNVFHFLFLGNRHTESHCPLPICFKRQVEVWWLESVS